MSSLFNHVFIPLVILLIFSDKLKIDPKKIFFLSFFGILPDADIFILHRELLHNIFILLIPVMVHYFLTDNKEAFWIIGFYLISHLVLDTFNGGIYVLYPIYDKVVYVHTDILFSHNNLKPIIDYGISDKIVNMGRSEGIISSENIGITVLLLIFVLISKLKKIR